MTNTIKKIRKTQAFLALLPVVLVLLLPASPARADDVTIYTMNFTQTAGSPAQIILGQFDVDNTNPSLSYVSVSWNSGTGPGSYDAGFYLDDSTLTAAWAGIAGLVPACGSSNADQQVVNVMEGCAGADPDWVATVSQDTTGPTSTTTLALLTGGTSFEADDVLIGIANTGPPIVESGYFTITPQTVAAPEPASLSLLTLGLAALSLLRRKTKPSLQAM
jgi:hypothetical protein